MSSSNHAVKSDDIITEDSVAEPGQPENISDAESHQIQLASTSETLEIKPIEPRLKSFESFMGRVTQITDDLGQSIKRLTGRVDDSENRLDDLEPTSELLEYTSRELVTKVAELDATDMALDDRVRQAEALQGQLDSRTTSLEEEVQTLHSKTAAIDEDIKALQRHSDLLEEAAEQQDNAIIGLASRLNYLEPKQQALQASHERLSQHTRRQDDQLVNLDGRLKNTSWVVGGVLLALTGAAATGYWYSTSTDQEFNQQLTGIQNHMSDQATTVAVSQAAIATISETNAQLDSDNKNLSHQISQIEARIYATDEDLSGAPVDLNEVNSMEWLNSQPASSYVIQLSGAYSKRAVADMIGKHNGAIETNEFAWFKTVNKGRDWFVLLHGSYASFDDALTEMEALPESLLNGGAYIRTFGGVQKSLQRK